MIILRSSSVFSCHVCESDSNGPWLHDSHFRLRLRCCCKRYLVFISRKRCSFKTHSWASSGCGVRLKSARIWKGVGHVLWIRSKYVDRDLTARIIHPKKNKCLHLTRFDLPQRQSWIEWYVVYAVIYIFLETRNYLGIEAERRQRSNDSSWYHFALHISTYTCKSQVPFSTWFFPYLQLKPASL